MMQFPTYQPKLQELKAALAVEDYISYEEAETRLLRAHKTLAVQPDREKGWLSGKSNWPVMLLQYSEQPIDLPPPRFEPTPFDKSDYLRALNWLRPLTKREQVLILWKSWDMSYGQMARLICLSDIFGRKRCSDQTAANYYKAAMSNAWAAASLWTAETAGCDRGKELQARLCDDRRADQLPGGQSVHSV